MLNNMIRFFNEYKCKQLLFFLIGWSLCTLFITSVDKKFHLWDQVKSYYFFTGESNGLKGKSITELSLEEKGDETQDNNLTTNVAPASREPLSQCERKTVFSSSTIFHFIKNIYQQNLQPYAHSPRYMLVYPFVKVCMLSQQDCDTFFTYFCCFLISVFALLGARTACLLEGTGNNFIYYYFGTLILFIIVALFMNGRLIYGFLAGACLLYGQTQWLIKNRAAHLCLLSFIAIALSNVSGGTFLVTFTSCLLFVIIFQIFSKYLWGFLIVFIPIGCMYTLKNFFYFNDIWGLLSHGYGNLITNVHQYDHTLGGMLLSTFIIMAFALFCYVIITAKKLPKFSPFLIYAYVTIVFGIFGWSTLSVVLCGLLILGPYLLMKSYYLYKAKDSKLTSFQKEILK